jgi:hypothetical protein
MAEKDFYTLEEVGELLNRSRATVFNRMNIIGMKPHKFKGDRKSYLSKEEVRQLRKVFDNPWLAPEKDYEAVGSAL